MKFDMLVCFMFLFAMLALTMHKPHPFSRRQALNSFYSFIENSVVNGGQKIMHSHSQVNMKCDSTVPSIDGFHFTSQQPCWCTEQ